MPKPDENTSKLHEIRIVQVPDKIHTQLNNIKEHLGMSLTSIIKPHLAKIIESYPEEYRRPVSNKD